MNHSKHEHAHMSFCSGGKCRVCLTPWPAKSPLTLLELQLQKLPDTSKLIQVSWGGFMPAGISGQDLWIISKRVEDENRKK